MQVSLNLSSVLTQGYNRNHNRNRNRNRNRNCNCNCNRNRNRNPNPNANINSCKMQLDAAKSQQSRREPNPNLTTKHSLELRSGRYSASGATGLMKHSDSPLNQMVTGLMEVSRDVQQEGEVSRDVHGTIMAESTRERLQDALLQASAQSKKYQVELTGFGFG